MDRSRTTAGACNIITRLALHSVTGYTVPIQVHQHHGLQFHLVLLEPCFRVIPLLDWFTSPCGHYTIKGTFATVQVIMWKDVRPLMLLDALFDKH